MRLFAGISKTILVPILTYAAWAQDSVIAGRKTFETRCSVCHGSDGNGGEMGPGIARRLRGLTDAQLKTTITSGIPARGMPAFTLKDTEMEPLVSFIHSLRPRRGFGFEPYHANVQITSGGTLDGMIIAEAFDEAALRTADERIHLLRKVDGGRFREVTSEVDWTTYNGDIGGNRYTKLTQINKTNVTRVAPRWMFTLPNVNGIQATPIVVEGVMYVTATNECYALDAGTSGHLITQRYQRPRTPGETRSGHR